MRAPFALPKPDKKALVAAVASVTLALSLALPVSAAHADPTAASKKAEAQAALTKLNEMQDRLDQASSDYSAALEEQAAAEAAEAEAQGKVEEAQARVDEETAKIQGYQEQLGGRARAMYRSGGNNFLDVILGASSFEEFATNWSMLETLNQNDAELVQRTKEARAALEEAKAEFEAQAQIAQEQAQVAADKASVARGIKEQAEAETAQMQATYDSLSAEAQQLLEEEEAARSAAAAAAAQAALASQSGSSSANVNNSKVQTVTGNIIVDRAYAQLGKPYVWGAAGPNSFDCSGLVGYCITGRMGDHWTYTGAMNSWTHVSNPQPGDFCLNSHHTGVYIGNGQMIHAPRTGDVVKISGVHAGMWYVRY